MDFYTSVRLWKLASAGLWSGFFNLVLSFVTCKLTGEEFRLFTYLIGVLFHFLLLFAHSMTLSIIPIRIADLELEDALMRLEWFVLHLVFLTVTALTWHPIYTDPMTTRTAATLGCLVTFVISRHEKFAVYIDLRKTPRSAKVFEIFWSFVLTILTSIFVFLAVWGAWFLSRSFRNDFFIDLFGWSQFWVYAHLLLVSAVTSSVSAVIFSEPVSFAAPKSADKGGEERSRIAEAMTMPGLFQFLAYEDLFDIATGAPARRRILFKDSSGRKFNEIVDSCLGVFHSFGTRYSALPNFTNGTDIHRLADARFRRSGQDRPRVSPRRSSPTGRDGGSVESRVVREVPVLESGVLVIFASRALVALLHVLKTEDSFGVGQRKAERILNGFMTLHETMNTDRVAKYQWAMAPFGRGWFASTPADIIVKARQVVDWALERLRPFAGRFDYESADLAPKHAELFKKRAGLRW